MASHQNCGVIGKSQPILDGTTRLFTTPPKIIDIQAPVSLELLSPGGPLSDLSNSYTLETLLNWKGALSEPSPQWHNELKKNRPNTDIITDCIWSESEKELDFFVSDIGVLSSLNDFKESDKISMPGNTMERIKNGRIISVKTISLNHVIEKKFRFKSPSYISIDTEGSEYEILKVFDFKKFRPIVFTIEHNFTELQFKIDELMKSNDYVRVFKKITAFDAWYISKEVFDLLDK